MMILDALDATSELAPEMSDAPKVLESFSSSSFSSFSSSFSPPSPLASSSSSSSPSSSSYEQDPAAVPRVPAHLLPAGYRFALLSAPSGQS